MHRAIVQKVLAGNYTQAPTCSICSHITRSGDFLILRVARPDRLVLVGHRQ
jgi:hypothetical protein